MKYVLARRTRALKELRSACRRQNGRLVDDLLVDTDGQVLEEHLLKLSAGKEAGRGEPFVRQLGRFANGLGLDGFEIAKWFLNRQDLEDKATDKRVGDAIRKDRRQRQRTALHAATPPTPNGTKVILNIGNKSFTYKLRAGAPIRICLELVMQE